MHFTYYGNTQASMLIGNFKDRLKRLNPQILIDEENATKLQGLRHAGIYLKAVKQAGLSLDTKGRGHGRVEKYYAALESGELNKFLCGVCLEWLPEYDIFNAEYTKIAVPGWRTILMQLIQKKVIDRDKARKVFSCPSLGEADYDRMSFFAKMQFAKKIDKVE